MWMQLSRLVPAALPDRCAARSTDDVTDAADVCTQCTIHSGSGVDCQGCVVAGNDRSVCATNQGRCGSCFANACLHTPNHTGFDQACPGVPNSAATPSRNQWMYFDGMRCVLVEGACPRVGLAGLTLPNGSGVPTATPTATTAGATSAPVAIVVRCSASDACCACSGGCVRDGKGVYRGGVCIPSPDRCLHFTTTLPCVELPPSPTGTPSGPPTRKCSASDACCGCVASCFLDAAGRPRGGACIAAAEGCVDVDDVSIQRCQGALVYHSFDSGNAVSIVCAAHDPPTGAPWPPTRQPSPTPSADPMVAPSVRPRAPSLTPSTIRKVLRTWVEPLRFAAIGSQRFPLVLPIGRSCGVAPVACTLYGADGGAGATAAGDGRAAPRRAWDDAKANHDYVTKELFCYTAPDTAHTHASSVVVLSPTAAAPNTASGDRSQNLLFWRSGHTIWPLHAGPASTLRPLPSPLSSLVAS
eukprot:gene30769-biopygen62500